MTKPVPRNTDSKQALHRSNLFVSLISMAGMAPGVFLAFSLFVMNEISFGLCLMVSLCLSLFGVLWATKNESAIWRDPRLWIIYGIQVIAVYVLVLSLGILEEDHVANPRYYFGLILIFVISGLLSHFVASWVVEMKLQKTTKNV